MNTHDCSFIFGLAVGFLGTLLLEVVFLVICFLIARKDDDDDE